MSVALQKLEYLLTNSHFEEKARSKLSGLPVRTFTSPSTVVIGFDIPINASVKDIERYSCHLQETCMIPLLKEKSYYKDGVLCFFKHPWQWTRDEDPAIQEKLWDLERDFSVCIKNVIYTYALGDWKEEDCLLSPKVVPLHAHSIWPGSYSSIVELGDVEIPIENANVLLYYEDSSVPLPTYLTLQRKLQTGSGADYNSSCLDVILEDKKRVEWMIRFREYMIANPESKFLVPFRSHTHIRHFLEKFQKVDISIGKITVKRGAGSPRISYRILK